MVSCGNLLKGKHEKLACIKIEKWGYINFFLEKKCVLVYMKIIVNDGIILEKGICVAYIKEGLLW